MTIRRALFWVYYVSFLLLSVFVIVAPRHLVEHWYGHLWAWVLLVPPVWWLRGFIRALYRGGE